MSEVGTIIFLVLSWSFTFGAFCYKRQGIRMPGINREKGQKWDLKSWEFYWRTIGREEEILPL